MGQQVKGGFNFMRKSILRILIFTLCLSILSIGFVAAEESNIYPDISDHPAQNAIEALFETGAINLTKDEAFGPDLPISRAHFLFMLLSTKGITPNAELKQTDFTDVSTSDWFYPYVETAYQLGIILGDATKENFYPNAAITNQEAIVMLMRSLGEGVVAKQFKSDRLTRFKDTSNVAVWAKNMISYAVDQNYYNGTVTKEGAFLLPNQELTKAEAATLVYNTLYQRLSLDDIQKEDVDEIPITYFKKLNVKAYAYTKEDKNVSNKSYTGLTLRVGLVAVDPEVIPLGTHLYIPGYGFAIAADKGSNIKGNTIDLCMEKLADAKKFGVKHNLSVYILDPISVSHK